MSPPHKIHSAATAEAFSGDVCMSPVVEVWLREKDVNFDGRQERAVGYRRKLTCGTLL
jgi:hypothetical protein